MFVEAIETRRLGMLQRVSKWGVTLLGLLLLVWGAAAMWNGWDVIQIERGWSLFIGGASAVAGGAVVCALGLVIGRLDRLIAAATPARKPSTAEPPAPRESKAPTPKTAEVESVESKSGDSERLVVTAPEPWPLAAKAAEPEAEPDLVEVDRYESGETTYVMFSDGAVEVRTAAGAQRYASLAELRSRAVEGA
jgi:hypothetical protein